MSSTTTAAHEFAQLACAAAGVQSLVPADRWDADHLYSAATELGKSYARFGAFVNVREIVCAGSEEKLLYDGYQDIFDASWQTESIPVCSIDWIHPFFLLGAGH